MFGLFLSTACVALTAAVISSLGKPRTFSLFLLSAYVVAAAEVVLLTQVLSLTSDVRPTYYLTTASAGAVAALAIWILSGAPRPPAPRLTLAHGRRHPVVAGLFVVVAAAIAYQLFLVASTPPNNWDSMTYHLSRVAAWHQASGVGEIEQAPTARQNESPPNAEMLVLYTFAFLGRDTLAGLPQLVAELALIVATYAVARALGFRRSASAFAALLTATLPEVALQSVTTQNDLVVASFVVAAAAFILEGRVQISSLALSGGAIGLAVGTKPTAILALVPLAVVAAWSLPIRRSLAAGAFAVVGVALLGSFGYALNVIHRGTPLPSSPEFDRHRPDVTADGTLATVARVLIRFIDLPGILTILPALVVLAVVASLAVAVAIMSRRRATSRERIPGEAIASCAVLLSPLWLLAFVIASRHTALDVLDRPESTLVGTRFELNIDADEDFAFFGPVGAVVLLPVVFALLLRSLRGHIHDRRQLALAVSLPIYVVALALAYRYNPWIGRFLLIPVGLAMPLIASIYRSKPLAAATACVGAIFLAAAHVGNPAKPTGFGESPSAWDAPRAVAQSLQRPAMRTIIMQLERELVDVRVVGAALGPDDWSYPLFGERLERRVVYLPRSNAFDAAEATELDAIVLSARHGIVDPPPGWRVERLGSGAWTLAYRTTRRSE